MAQSVAYQDGGCSRPRTMERTSSRSRTRCARSSRTRISEKPRAAKRAQGGSDFDLDRLVALCPRCHAQTDAPYARGRLVITPLGAGRFTVEITRGADKWGTVRS